MKRTWLFALTVLSAALLAAPGAVRAQAYPDKPVRILVGYSAGGATDTVARLIGRKLSEAMGQQFVVENRPGAGGNIAADLLVRSAPDGYTLIMVAPAHSINATLYRKLDFDPVKDFAPVAQVAAVTNLMVVHPSLGVKTVAELVALAKAEPGRLSYASAGNGASSHLAAELFKAKMGIDILHVPYKGTGQSITDLLAGQVQITMDSMPALLPHVRAGKLVPLAVGGAKRSPALPDVPTVSEVAVPGYEVTVWLGLLAPANTSPAIIAELNRHVQQALTRPDMREQLAAIGAEPAGGSPEQFGSLIAREIAKYAEVIKSTGAQVD